VQWTFNGTGVNPPNPTTVAGATTIVKRFSQTGDKSTTVVVNPGASDQFNAGQSNGSILNGFDPGFGTVQIGNFDIDGTRPRNPGTVTEGTTVVFQGNVVAPVINPGPLTVPFTNVFEIALDGCQRLPTGGGTCPVAGIASDLTVPAGQITSISSGDSIQVLGTWVSALLGDENGDGVGTHGIRLCADDQDVIVETDEPNPTNNCGPWRYFEVVPIPPPPIDATCSVTPVIVNVNDKKTITWSVTTSGGNGVYSYAWRGSESLTGSTPSVTKVYELTGEKEASVTVTSPGAPNSPMDVVCTKKVLVRQVVES
jgi:hypothetical protein